MKIQKYIPLALFLIIMGIVFHILEAPQAGVASRTWKEAIDYAQKNLSHSGPLMAKSDGFIYLKVDDDYIHQLFPLLGLADEGFREPAFFRSPHSLGAHISVFYVDEHVSPEEIGRTFNFDLKRIVLVHPSRNSSFAVLQVKSPELEKLREKYGRSRKLHGREFHISLAEKKG